VWAAVRTGSRASLAARLGAHAVLPSDPAELVAQVAHRIGAAPLMPWSKCDWLQDGPAVVYDTIGSTEAVETALRLLATGGTPAAPARSRSCSNPDRAVAGPTSQWSYRRWAGGWSRRCRWR
jgi:threonine dehydrogenase-like Zn-dependent dehydrogenase